jgi:hypothetical protein
MKKIKLYDRRKVKGVIYLEKMEKFHNQIMAKVIHIEDEYYYRLKRPLCEASLKAFRCAYQANENFPSTRKSIEKRKDLLHQALLYMEKCENDLFSLFYYLNYRDDVIENFTNLLVEIVKLLKSIISSDSKRLKKLES